VHALGSLVGVLTNVQYQHRRGELRHLFDGAAALHIMRPPLLQDLPALLRAEQAGRAGLQRAGFAVPNVQAGTHVGRD